MKKFYITGISGVGKSSVSEILNQKGIFSIDIDSVKNLCYWINKHTKEKSYWHPGKSSEWLESHQYICDKDKLIALMNTDKDIVVVVGLADNQSDFLNLFDKVFLFHCKEEIFLKRLDERNNNDFGKHSSEKEMILAWYKDFEKALLDWGVISINTDRPILDVVREVISKFKNFS
ncbi:hypothetical protein A2641_00110 [Candidatus Nomurabacteria bacterium RIFCSPHIGHO2_01_FULL_37_25]|uniref:Shikimate kinase n=1 Tax=Candidatus Nomurabacteria bacterium RIFCSPLOWO2_01_FULL_36_16 TaxID=1801767 RepID=A0A1F6WYB2_9BACT|nr:MAG: hypothetical protein A2641_00110 [Candidatus Nomurabacteria bacterium RIFCSPHIGHO2_01_FULL_37_25]OGI75216.1 MAG: hypothetical protein A3D36_03785 [Candidatus Nomurabacteria bacterium RIFCSPHIGHO2_02_FULL_36_29]OGI86860.1 MAG: hypothetical protein A3A91_03240 [Candidatus Nomurabacteria bacterium RIFCSPLOWO2_01_FULL_36_16]OGI96790.1 MAG: hypothetical protein A3I84_00050 [Candidatus Nomurabacteria bacterium RIFCSPLOWO2_02_FULL_36_8]